MHTCMRQSIVTRKQKGTGVCAPVVSGCAGGREHLRQSARMCRWRVTCLLPEPLRTYTELLLHWPCDVAVTSIAQCS